MSLIDNVQDARFASSLEIDKILGTFEGSFSATGGGAFNRESFNTSISESTFFQGIFSIDNGTTWRDFGMWGQAGLDVSVYGRSNASTFTIHADNVGSTVTVLYKVALIAKPGQGDIQPQSIGADIVFDSRLNYQKIAVDTSSPVSVTDTNEVTESFTHDLGYIPKVRSFIEISSNFGVNTPAGIYETGQFGVEAFSVGSTTPNANFDSSSGVYLTTDSAVVVLNNQTGRGDFSGTLYMRVYYDA